VSHRVKHAVNQVAHDLGGTFSAEHGIGQALTQEMALFKPAVEVDLMRGIKAQLDPLNLFNPGRLLPPASRPPQ
jgi:FAD/FMN-containing dehydrogenase